MKNYQVAFTVVKSEVPQHVEGERESILVKSYTEKMAVMKTVEFLKMEGIVGKDFRVYEVSL